MITITKKQFDEVSLSLSDRRSKNAEIIKNISGQLESVESEQVACFTAKELYGKDTAHYYALSKLLKTKQEAGEISSFRFEMAKDKHANFVNLYIVK